MYQTSEAFQLRDSLMQEPAATESGLTLEKPEDTPARPDAGRAPRLVARTLFGTARELVIEHGGEEYRLRITQSGKLILTK